MQLQRPALPQDDRWARSMRPGVHRQLRDRPMWWGHDPRSGLDATATARHFALVRLRRQAAARVAAAP